MERIDPIYLTKNDLDMLRNFEVGHGTDGSVFRFGKHGLIKIYHSLIKNILSAQDCLEDEMKIFNKNDFKLTNFQEPITYYHYTDEDIKLRSKDAIKLAISRQKDITRTNLPKNMVYVEGKFAGCLLKRQKGIQIHKLSGLPMAAKKKIILETIESVQELLDHYIYHIDLSNSPYAKTYYNNDGIIEKVGHSHVLVQPLTGKTNIIDLDGKSTVYMEHKSQKYEEQCLFNLCVLIVEFLFGIDNDEYEEEMNLDEELYRLGIKDEFIEPLSQYSLTIEQAKDFVKTL